MAAVIGPSRAGDVTPGRAARGATRIGLVAFGLATVLPAHACVASDGEDMRRPDQEAGAAAEVFTERVAIFLYADSADLEAIRAEYGEEDFEVIADDLSWYRAEVRRWLADHGIAIVSRDGRPPLRFRVEGRTRVYDFSAEPSADVVVLYEPGREPRALAPVDVSFVAPDYFDPEAP